MTKQRILFITTGGTIASVHTPQGLRPVLSSDELLAHLPELNDLCIPETLALCSIDSTDLGQEHWLMMARAIQENYALYDGFIICHGTDTLGSPRRARRCRSRSATACPCRRCWPSIPLGWCVTAAAVPCRR